MKKRIAIIGKGTAGSQAVTHYLNHMSDCEIQWYFDPDIPTQSVGEGSNLIMPINLYNNINFSYSDFYKIDATLKVGIWKSGWGKNQNDYMHHFPPSHTAMHFNAKSLQDFILNFVKDKVTIIEKNVSADEIDADYVMDCSGKPKTYDDFNKSSFIPVNSAYITQCYWDLPRFQHTLTIARPYGWVFGIPLKHRCSIGYLYNRNINTLEEVKEDVKNVFKDFDLTPSQDINSLQFENYYRKENHTERVTYNGNASFFLEPLEATSFSVVDYAQRNAYDIWNSNISVQDANQNYKRLLKETEVMIMLHYFAGSIYESKFWEYARENGQKCIENAIKNDEDFNSIVRYSILKKYSNKCEKNIMDYGTWWPGSFCENIDGLGIKEKLLSMM